MTVKFVVSLNRHDRQTRDFEVAALYERGQLMEVAGFDSDSIGDCHAYDGGVTESVTTLVVLAV